MSPARVMMVLEAVGATWKTAKSFFYFPAPCTTVAAVATVDASNPPPPAVPPWAARGRPSVKSKSLDCTQTAGTFILAAVWLQSR